MQFLSGEWGIAARSASPDLRLRLLPIPLRVKRILASYSRNDPGRISSALKPLAARRLRRLVCLGGRRSRPCVSMLETCVLSLSCSRRWKISMRTFLTVSFGATLRPKRSTRARPRVLSPQPARSRPRRARCGPCGPKEPTPENRDAQADPGLCKNPGNGRTVDRRRAANPPLFDHV